MSVGPIFEEVRHRGLRKNCCFDVKVLHRHEFVYVLVFAGDIVKIGRSADPAQRINQHIATCSVRFEGGYLFAVLDAVKAEQALLDWYCNFKLNDGEWFVIPIKIRNETLSGKKKLSVNGSAFWPYCGYDHECELCNELEDLESVR